MREEEQCRLFHIPRIFFMSEGEIRSFLDQNEDKGMGFFGVFINILG